MGGVASHFSDTDWGKADGGLKEASETFDGAKPTATHSIFYLSKRSIVNQRDCELKDEDDTLLYTTTSVEGTTKDFDLLAGSENKLFHVQTDSVRSTWDIYSYSPNFEGQAPQNEKGQPLYRKANVRITWDKHHGVITLYEQSPEDPQGSLSKEHSLRIEEIKSITPQFQSFVPKMSLVHPQLCGYWIREHTEKRDRIKFHLAKGTDVALHCILAVITNIVHVEREAEKCV